jgi:hypothetical protein
VALASAAGVLVLGLIAVGVGLGPSAITKRRLQHDIRVTFNRLTIYQQQLLGRRVVPGTRINDTASCARRGSARSGPGGDWVCTLIVLVPHANSPDPQFEPVDYDLSVKVNGCWSAEGPPSFVGNQTFRTPHGASVVNPLFRLEGCFNPI